MANYNVNTISSQFLFSYEGRSFLVNGLYFKILGRTPAEPLGLDFWTKALLAGASDENIIGNILGSDEYYSNHHWNHRYPIPDFNWNYCHNWFYWFHWNYCHIRNHWFYWNYWKYRYHRYYRINWNNWIYWNYW